MTFALALASMPVHAADATGVYSLVDGDARALRGTTWFRLVAGTRVLEGDVIDVGDDAQIQLELKDGGTLNAQGPALMYATAIPPVDGKPGAVAELIVQHGWLKAAGKVHELEILKDEGHRGWEPETLERVLTRSIAFIKASFA